MDTFTGNWSWSSGESNDYRFSRQSTPVYTSSNLEAPPPMNTFGKTTQLLQERDSNLARNLFGETLEQIGPVFESTRNVEISEVSPMIYTFVITVRSKELAKTYASRLLWTEAVQFSSVRLELVKAIGPGVKQGYKLILRTPSQSGGVATKLKNTLLSMNFVVLLVSPIYYGGLTDIQSWWKPKEELDLLWQSNSGSPPMLSQSFGTQNWMRPPEML